jgi:hypothetical protein
MASSLRLICLALWLCAAAFSLATPARADSWAGPQVREVFSASRDHFVRVIPGNSIGDTVGFAGAAKGEYASAEFYRREGDRLYRLVTSARRGYGIVLAVYDGAGKPVKAYTLADLFSRAEIDASPHSVSSIAWHSGPVYINQDQRTLYMMVASGRDLVLGLQTGRFAYCETRAGKYLCRNSNSKRRWLPYKAAAPQE